MHARLTCTVTFFFTCGRLTVSEAKHKSASFFFTHKIGLLRISSLVPRCMHMIFYSKAHSTGEPPKICYYTAPSLPAMTIKFCAHLIVYIFVLHQCLNVLYERDVLESFPLFSKFHITSRPLVYVSRPKFNTYCLLWNGGWVLWDQHINHLSAYYNY